MILNDKQGFLFFLNVVTRMTRATETQGGWIVKTGIQIWFTFSHLDQEIQQCLCFTAEKWQN